MRRTGTEPQEGTNELVSAGIRAGTRMSAIVQDRYGPPAEVLKLDDIRTPKPADDEALVRIHAASIHIGDCYVSRGVPYVMRPVFGIRGPRNRVPGTDISGEVAAVGKDVSAFEPGDQVFGWCRGAFAEYAAVSEDSLAPKPANLSSEQAAAVGVSAFTALQGLRDRARVQPGQHVLINGASGGVGTFAVQIAKAFGAQVTGVCSSKSAEMVRSIGADHTIDYAQQDFTSGSQRYDLIFDNVGNHSLADTRRALTPGGLLLSNGAPVGGWFGGLGRVIAAAVSSLFVRRQARPFVSAPNADDLLALKELTESGMVTPVIDGAYPLRDTADAIAHVARGHSHGTTIVIVRDEAVQTDRTIGEEA